MKSALHLIILLIISTVLKAQIGIGISTLSSPAATLEIKADPTNRDSPAGIKAPRFTKHELINKKSASGVYTYNNTHKGTYVYVTDISLPLGIEDITETKGIVDKGLYYFNGRVWVGISSDLGKVSIYASASTSDAVINSAGTGVQNFDGLRKALFLNFGENDIIYEGVSTLKSATYTMVAGGEQISSYFQINEDGLYEISGYVIINPHYGNLSLGTRSDFIPFNLFFSKAANVVDYGSNSTTPQPITGVRSIVSGPNGGIPDIIYIPPTVVELAKDTNIYFSAVNTTLTIGNTTGKLAKNDSSQKKFNVSRFFNNEEIFPYEKYVLIRKL